ncbi:MAG: hypothetical protein GYA69_02640 [Candidatus Moranbacteria bacterium]|nr:hypothetical protein [Candidatus Moranbacteria bacterium]
MFAFISLLFAGGAIWFSRHFLRRYFSKRKAAKKEKLRLLMIMNENERNFFSLQKLLISAGKKIGEVFEVSDHLPKSSRLTFENASREVRDIERRFEQLKHENSSDPEAVRSKLKDYDFEQRISESMGKLHSLKLKAEELNRKRFKLYVVRAESNAKK